MHASRATLCAWLRMLRHGCHFGESTANLLVRMAHDLMKEPELRSQTPFWQLSMLSS